MKLKNTLKIALFHCFEAACQWESSGVPEITNEQLPTSVVINFDLCIVLSSRLFLRISKDLKKSLKENFEILGPFENFFMPLESHCPFC